MRIVMMGTGPFAVPTFQALLDSSHDVAAVVTRPPRPVRGRRTAAVNPMRDLAEQRDVPVQMPETVNDTAARDELAQWQVDLMVVCDFGQILSSQTLATARLGGVNLHGSLLPKYRGAAPVNWAVYHGETETGVTVIHMTPALDAGPCLVQRSVPIGPEETAEQLEPRLATLGVDAVMEALTMLASWDGQSPIGTVQDAAVATKAPRLTKRDGQVDWSRTARQIADQIRAFKPWPGTFTTWPRGKKPMRLILDAVSVVEPPPAKVSPGAVALSDGQRLIVGCGEGTALSLERVQPAGKRPMPVADLLRGYAIDVGTRFE